MFFQDGLSANSFALGFHKPNIWHVLMICKYFKNYRTFWNHWVRGRMLTWNMGWCMGGGGPCKAEGGCRGRGCATHNQLHHFRCNSTFFLRCAIFRCLAGSVFVWKRHSLSAWCRKGSSCRQKTIWPFVFPATSRTACAAKHTYAFAKIIFLDKCGNKHETSKLQSHKATCQVSTHHLWWSQAEKSEPGWDITSQIQYDKPDPCLLPLDSSSNHIEKQSKTRMRHCKSHPNSQVGSLSHYSWMVLDVAQKAKTAATALKNVVSENGDN